ncbi:MAG TPA: bifunctional riboflavin kinase/FAD synthetase [Burkholderiaceae bacterium]|nr:bifunctional riboflavin kinase/FAD synthetase [Burkholderiaceae bacterium]
MKVYRGVPPLPNRVPCALTVGNFDGVHRGHQALLTRVVASARERNLTPAVMTFEPHPREFFTPERAPARVSNLRDKLASFERCGIDRTFVAHFNRRFAHLTPTAFVDGVLIAGCEMKWLLVGDDFRFGARRAGDTALLADYASRGAFELEVMPTVLDDGERISSTAVRQALAAGDLIHASTLLGRAYAISGRVLHGRKLGRSLGFPTLNLKIEHVHPALQGIFAVRVHCLAERAVAGVASIGLRPTLDNSGRWLLEVHLFDFAEAVYGRLVTVEFVKKLRNEQKYETLGALSAAIGDDAVLARSILNGAVAS